MSVKFWLSTNEVIELTGAKSRSKQLKVLEHLGYSYRVRPDGTFIVPVEQFTVQKQTEYAMDFSALG